MYEHRVYSRTSDWQKTESLIKLIILLKFNYLFYFRLYYHQVSANTSGFTAIETDVTTVRVESLLPNTQYIVYATALTYAANANATLVPIKKIESEPSETLVAWTDPAFPAFVEVRMVKSSPQKHTFGKLVSPWMITYTLLKIFSFIET